MVAGLQRMVVVKWLVQVAVLMRDLELHLVCVIRSFWIPGDLALASSEKLTNQKDSNAQLFLCMFHNDS